MKKHLFAIALSIGILIPEFVLAQDKDELDRYIQHLKDDKAGPVKETGFMSAGSDFLYGQEYFDAKNYFAATGYFLDVVRKQKDNAFANYQLAISLIRQNDQYKKQQAQEYLDAAFRLNPSLQERYTKDIPGQAIPANNTTHPDKNISPADNIIRNKTSNSTGLAGYIAALKYSRATGGAETAMNTAGLEAFYGIEYYEANEYRSAETSLSLALAKDPNNPYVNYMMAVSLAAQGKDEAAKVYLEKAVTADPSLKESYNNDVAKAKIKWQKLVESRKIKISPPAKKNYGGTLIYGDYTCHHSVWNGPNKSPAYSFQYKGYFALKADGTYRWLDNGETGKYKYDAKTGNIAWLSGYFKTSGAKSTQYQVSNQSAQMTVNLTDTYRWECGCKKK